MFELVDSKAGADSQWREPECAHHGGTAGLSDFSSVFGALQHPYPTLDFWANQYGDAD